MLQAIEGLINSDGRIILKDFVMPKKPIRVKVIIMDNENYQEAGLSDIGDYLEQLEDYEEVLAKGQVKQFKRQYNGQS